MPLYSTRVKCFLILFSIFIIFCFVKPKAYATLTGTIFRWNNNEIPSILISSQNFIEIANADSHSIALKNDGTVWTWGKNSDGQLGDGTLVDKIQPVQVRESNGSSFLNNVKQIASSGKYSLALKNDGTVWVWGFNGSGLRGTGQGIGNSSAPPLLYPTQVKINSTTYLTDVKFVAAGANHSLALKNNGTIYSWGTNNAGQLGIGCTSTSTSNCTNRFYPTLVPNISNVDALAAGFLHSLALLNDGHVLGWGRAFEGQIGFASNGEQNTPNPSEITGLSNIVKISAKYHSTVALSNEGKVFELGKGRWVTDPAGVNPRLIPSLSAADIGAGKDFDFAVKNDGSVWQWSRSNINPVQVVNLLNISKVQGSVATPNLALEKIDTPTPTPSVSPTPVPFLELPWDYASDGNTFSDAALSINSYFDHEYPVLSDSNILEGDNYKDSIVTFMGLPRSTTKNYSSHDGYDWGKAAKANLHDDVLAAASGTASFKNTCSACGNMIVIDHGNGYQTKYMHLLNTGLITNNTTISAQVVSGQKIGEVGSTGRSTGPHIHFGVFQDKDHDGNFGDNFTDGATDPFGWQSNDNDPWSLFTFTQGGVEKSGNKSYYLWKNKIDSASEEVPIQGKKIVVGKYTFDFPPNSIYYPLKVDLLAAPNVNPTSDLSSLGTIIKAEAENSNGKEVNSFDKPFTLEVDYSKIDLQKYKIGTLSIYSSFDGNSWTQEPTTLDTVNKIASSKIDHMTYFALMAERADTIPPTTNIDYQGEMGDDKWFRSDVKVSLEALDNENGLGIYYTGVSINDDDWNQYSEPIFYDQEGSHSLSFYSVDNDENVEETKKEVFFIDKTKPQLSIEASKNVLWPPNGKLVPIKLSGSASDENLKNYWVIVTDEYQEITPIITTLSQTIYLPASRHGDDIDGRTFTVKAQAQDKAGNVTENIIYITVPHDMDSNNQPSIPSLTE